MLLLLIFSSLAMLPSSKCCLGVALNVILVSFPIVFFCLYYKYPLG